MKTKALNYLVTGLLILAAGCSKENPEIMESEINATKLSAGAIQVGGVGFFAEEAECDLSTVNADFALLLTGDFEGCLLTIVDDFGCSPSGTYRESGREYFVGTYKGEAGTFWTTYKFEAKYEGCSEEGFFLGAEIFGRCQHPIVKGSGTGVFEGVTGRINFKDNVETGELPYSGHLRY